MSEKNKEGWTYLTNSPKWHYFRNGQSLCKKYALLMMPDLEVGNNNSPDNCKACQRQLSKEAP